MAVTPYSKPETQAHAVESATLSSLVSVHLGSHYRLLLTVMISSLGLTQAQVSAASLDK